jgi:hypothetical protein
VQWCWRAVAAKARPQAAQGWGCKAVAGARRATQAKWPVAVVGGVVVVGLKRTQRVVGREWVCGATGCTPALKAGPPALQW